MFDPPGQDFLDTLWTPILKAVDGGARLEILQMAEIELCVRPTPHERLFSYHIRLAQVLGQGCCYMTGPQGVDHSLIGQSVVRVQSGDMATRIAVMDGIYAGLSPTPAASATLTGNLFERSRARAGFMVDHTRARYGLKARDRVVLVGVVGEIIRSFTGHGIEVIAYDLDANLVGQRIAQTTIQDGALLDRGIPEAALVLATGMTIWNQTLQPLIALSQQTRTPVALFAETGAHLAPFFIPLGVDSVFSEPFPFYVFGNNSVIHFYNELPNDAVFTYLIGQ